MDWQPIETAPSGKLVILFAVTDIAEDGEVRNWKMAVGSKHGPPSPMWNWDGHWVKKYGIQPTHWQSLPPPPK